MWSFKEQRQFIEIAKSAKSLEEIVKRTGRTPRALRRAALRLGVKLAEPRIVRADLKAKAK